MLFLVFFFFFSSRRRHTRCSRDWSSDVCSSDLWDYSGGLQTDLVVHHLNTLHYLMNEPAPGSAITYGGSYRGKKVHPEAEGPDGVQKLFEDPHFTYNVSLTLNSSNQGVGASFMGATGT